MTSVAQAIQEHEGEILALWQKDARASASARGLSPAAVESVMPKYLSTLADRSAADDPATWDRQREWVREHLGTRLREGFDLADILDEFALLERCITAMWVSAPRERWPEPADVERLHDQIRFAIREATAAFHRHMLEDEQAEKRYLRLLQAIATEALQEGAAPLRVRLPELLEIVMEAMHAECAAFLAYDAAREQLVLEACVGAEAPEAYAASLGPTSFAGEVATHDAPIQLFDMASTRLEVPGALRASGIRSLLGARLLRRNELLGVMYVGVCEAREFTLREVGRIIALADRLALHLENARLFAALHDKIRDLDLEKAMRERFVSMLAHDLRGPLASARLAAELLTTSSVDPARREELGRKIARNIDRVDQMIRDLLDANRLRAGEPLPVRLEPCDYVAMAADVIDEARALHGERFVVTASEPVQGTCSHDELHRALWNLVTNAVKYGAPQVPITITVERRDRVARISVHNEGEPIPAAEQPHIFDPYTRARAAHASGRGGWGLGLTLVRGTAEAHGGHVSVASDAESGTTFTIEIPLDASAVRRDEDESTHGAVGSAG